MDFVSDLVDKFQNLDEGTRQNIITWAGFAAAIGPALMAIGGITRGIGGLVTGFGVLAKTTSLVLPLLTSPVGLGIAGVAAFAALASAAYGADKNVKTLNEKLKNTELGIKPDSASTIKTAITDALSGAQKVHEIAVQITAEKEDIKKQILAIFTDGKAESKEDMQKIADTISPLFKRCA